MTYLIKILTFVIFALPPLLLTVLHSIYYILGSKVSARRKKVSLSRAAGGSSISIIIPIKNEPENLVLEAIKHLSKLRNELGSNYEIIVVSDDPPDRAAVLGGKVSELANSLNLRVRFINRCEGPPGRAAALNYGVKVAKGDIVILLDVDSRPAKGYISRLVKCVENGNDACVGRWEGYWLKPTKLANAIAASMNFIVDVIYRGRAAAGFFTFPLGSGTAFRRESLLKVGLWNPRIIQDDMHIGTKLMISGLRTDYDDGAVLNILVPSTYEAFKIQQTRWAFGAAEVLGRSLRKVLNAPYPLLKKLEALVFLAQYVPQAIIGLSLIAVPIIALVTRTDVMFINYEVSAFTFGVLGLYAASFYHSLMRSGKFGRDKVKIIKIMGASGAITITLSPFILYYTLKGLLKRSSEYRITPKGSLEESIKSSKLIEKVFVIALLIAFILMLIKGPLLFTALWVGTALAAFIYTLTQIEKVVKR